MQYPNKNDADSLPILPVPDKCISIFIARLSHPLVHPIHPSHFTHLSSSQQLFLVPVYSPDTFRHSYDEQNVCTYCWRSRICRVTGGGPKLVRDTVSCGDADLPFSYITLRMAIFLETCNEETSDFLLTFFHSTSTSAHLLLSY